MDPGGGADIQHYRLGRHDRFQGLGVGIHPDMIGDHATVIIQIIDHYLVSNGENA